MHPPDAYITDLLPRLFAGRGPARSVVAAGSTPPGALQWWALPSARRVRLLVPVGGRGASVMLHRHDSGGRSRARAVVAWAVRNGLASRLPIPRLHLDRTAEATAVPTPGGLEQLLREVVGDYADIGLLLGPPRPNRKPVLQVFGRSGDVLAFVKVGMDPATALLVRQEASCLARVSAVGFRLVEPPTVLAATALAGVELLVLAPLVSSQRRGRDPRAEPPLMAMAEVAGSQGVSNSTLQSSPFWQGVDERIGSLAAGPVRERLDRVARAVQERYGTSAVVMGSWHGDWAPWNMGREGERVQVWDWERYAGDVPWGLDLVHHLAQRVRHTSTGRLLQEEALLRDLPTALAASGPHGRAQDADLLVLAYLLTISLRFVATGEQDEPATTHPRVLWATGLAERLLDRENVST